MATQTVIFAGGGTGGHLFPGIAVARELFESELPIDCLFIGTHRHVEKDILSKTKFEHVGLSIEPASRLLRNPLKFTWHNWKAYRHAKKILLNKSACCVIGLGGFASLPVLYAAKSLSLPVILMEQNVVLGRANRWFSPHTQAISLAFEETKGMKPATKNCSHFTGNPVRQEISSLHQSRTQLKESSAPMLLVLGGSQGAAAVNQVVMDAFALCKTLQQQDWKIVHQTGTEMVQEVTEFYQKNDVQAEVAPFFSDMTPLYQSADLVISRAGATTLAELSCAGCPVILVPYPDSVGDHQLLNALYFEQANSARVVEQQSSLTETTTTLQVVISELLNDLPQLENMRKAMFNLATPQAATNVANLITEIIETL